MGGIGHLVAHEIQQRTGKGSRCVVLGHLQRGGVPTQWDRQLCTRFGVYAVHMIGENLFGQMVALGAHGMEPVQLVDAIADIRRVPPDGELVLTARALGVSFGDEESDKM